MSQKLGCHAERRLRARLTMGQQSREVIPLSATRQLGMAAPGQIQLTVVTKGVKVLAGDVQQRGTATGMHIDGRWRTPTGRRASWTGTSEDRNPTKMVRPSTGNLLRIRRLGGSSPSERATRICW